MNENDETTTIDIDKMRAAAALLTQVDTLMSEAGAYNHPAGLASTYGLRDLIEDLDIDIDRIASGTLDD